MLWFTAQFINFQIPIRSTIKPINKINVRQYWKSIYIGLCVVSVHLVGILFLSHFAISLPTFTVVFAEHIKRKKKGSIWTHCMQSNRFDGLQNQNKRWKNLLWRGFCECVLFFLSHSFYFNDYNRYLHSYSMSRQFTKLYTKFDKYPHITAAIMCIWSAEYCKV